MDLQRFVLLWRHLAGVLQNETIPRWTLFFRTHEAAFRVFCFFFRLILFEKRPSNLILFHQPLVQIPWKSLGDDQTPYPQSQQFPLGLWWNLFCNLTRFLHEPKKRIFKSPFFTKDACIMTQFTADSASMFLEHPPLNNKMSLFGLWNCGFSDVLSSRNEKVIFLFLSPVLHDLHQKCTVDGSEILNNHLGCTKACKEW